MASRSLRCNFAGILGAQVIATTSTAEKAERLKALGASEVINYVETLTAWLTRPSRGRPDYGEHARPCHVGEKLIRLSEVPAPGGTTVDARNFRTLAAPRSHRPTDFLRAAKPRSWGRCPAA